MKRGILFLTVLLWPVAAADPPGFAIWTSAQLKQVDAKMGGQENGSQTLLDLGKNRAMFFHREASGTPELHELDADLWFIQSGSGAMIVGGRIIGAKKTAENEIRGTSIEGGTEHKVAAGDVIHIPANTPHQFLLSPKATAGYFLMKIR